MKIPRKYQDLSTYLVPNKVLVIYGSRQVGKTTLLQDFLSQTDLKHKFDSGDNISTRQVLNSEDFTKIKEYASGYDLIVIDEAQRIPAIGIGLKILVDNIPDIKIIATGSSSFELAGQVGEPLTGRKKTLIMYPVSQMELAGLYNHFELKQKLNEILVFGSYPAVITAPDNSEKVSTLEEITNSYLFKDILELDKVRSPKLLLDLLRLIAYQVGNEVSLTELGGQVGLDYKTVKRYLDLLEKSFIIYNLRGYSKNLRKEITKKSKYYFYDNGIRNAIIANFNPLEIRNDIGQLWENFLVTERIKCQKYSQIISNNYFWRTWDQQEVDWIEERNGNLYAYEFKYSPDKKKFSREFQVTYPEAKIQIINTKNYLKFLDVQ